MKYFGTDGIRGKSTMFTAEFLKKTAQAVKAFYGKINVVVARDPRNGGEEIALTFSRFLEKAGIVVTDAGMLPTPALAYLTRNGNAEIGVMVSASHNPPEYNGLKFFSGKGAKISTAEEEALEALIDASDFQEESGGAYRKYEDGLEDYLNYIRRAFSPDLKGLKVVLDGASGAAGSAAVALFRGLGATVTALNAEGDGERINVGTGAAHPEYILKESLNSGADIAFSYDGDGDRVMAAVKGVLVDGDRMMYAAAKYFKEKDRLSPPVLVGTLMTNLGAEKALNELGIELVRTPVGDKYVSAKMEEGGFPIGGERSGHIIFSEFAATGDGILTSLITAAVAREKDILEYSDYGEYPTATDEIVTDERGKKVFVLSPEIAAFKAYLETEGEGRIIARPSGTEPVIRLTAEDREMSRAMRAVKSLKAYASKILELKSAEKDTEQAVSDTLIRITSESKLREAAKAGAVIMSPETTFIADSVKLGRGAKIYPMNVLDGTTEIGENAVVYSYCDLTDTVVGANSEIRSSYAVGARIGERTTVGPFACLRAGSTIGNASRIGDFVEVKNSVLGDGVKAAHLTYIGDADVGAGTNVGCGTVFANYDGVKKRRSRVGEGVFIGCNTNLIAPVNVGDGAYIAGGSTVTDDVPEDALCIARERQTVKKEWRKKPR